jgi:hypothetical protein
LEPESATSDLAAAALDGQMRHSPANQSEVVKRLRAIGFEAATPAMSKRALTLMRVLADAHGQPTVGQSRISAASNVVLWGLAAGETAMPHAPEVRAGSASVVPEAYKLFNHTVDSVQNLVAGIDYDPHFRVFVLEGAEGPVIQVGIVGRENYPYNADHPEKMVYGRRWRVEKYFPTSEIYQTVMLALQKAEEHEVRELFRYRKSTPYTGHVDFEVLKKLVPTIENSSAAHADKTSVQRLLDDVSFGGHKLKLVTVQQRPNGSTVYEVRFEREPNAKRALEEYDDQVLTFVADGNKSSQILSSLMDTLIGRTRRKVEEGLRIDGFPRFSHDISPDTLRDASVAVWRDARREAAPEFAEIERALEYGVAEARAPVLPDGAANRRAYEVVEEKDLEGVMPTRQNSTNKI